MVRAVQNRTKRDIWSGRRSIERRVGMTEEKMEGWRKAREKVREEGGKEKVREEGRKNY